jgi:hypothetical protein
MSGPLTRHSRAGGNPEEAWTKLLSIVPLAFTRIRHYLTGGEIGPTMRKVRDVSVAGCVQGTCIWTALG